MPDIHRLFLLIFTLMFFWYVEKFRFITTNYKKWKHISANSLFSLTAIPVQILLGLIILKATDYNLKMHSGLVHFHIITNLDSIGLQCLIVFIVLDFLEYIYHLAMHKYKRLWMMHVVHHSDKVVDVSTTLREHPLETFTRLTFLIVFIYLTGTEYWMLMLRQAIQLVSNILSHVNFRLPRKVNSIIGIIFITPNMHHIHHHHELPHTNKNYGDVLSIWDRIFGTYSEFDNNKIVFGVDTFEEIEINTTFKSLLKIPFEKYRPTIKKS